MTSAMPQTNGASAADSLERLITNWFVRAVGEDVAAKAQADVVACDENDVDQQVQIVDSKLKVQPPKDVNPTLAPHQLTRKTGSALDSCWHRS